MVPSEAGYPASTIIMKFIPNYLVGQVNFSSKRAVNVQRLSSTHVITTRQQYKKTVLDWGCQTMMYLGECHKIRESPHFHGNET